MRLAIRAPDHLGDGVMALPAVAALARLGPAVVHAPRWGGDLYGFLGVRVAPAEVLPEGDVGVLFKPSFGAAWRWRGLPRRVGLASAGRGPLLTDAVPERVEHRREGYARVATALGATVTPTPYLARGRAPRLPRGAVLLHAWSPSPTVRWPGFPALAAAIERRAPVVWHAGPGEESAVRELAGPHATVLSGLSLPVLASVLESVPVLVSNDSGVAHLAAAVGARVVVVHGSTAPQRTGVGTPVVGPALWCAPCYRKWCFNDLRCLRGVSVEAVLAAVGRIS